MFEDSGRLSKHPGKSRHIRQGTTLVGREQARADETAVCRERPGCSRLRKGGKVVEAGGAHDTDEAIADAEELSGGIAKRRGTSRTIGHRAYSGRVDDGCSVGRRWNSRPKNFRK